MLVAFFFRVTATPQLSTLSLHDALPISFSRALLRCAAGAGLPARADDQVHRPAGPCLLGDDPAAAELHVIREIGRATRLNSSHEWISYAVFCLKKKSEAPRETEPTEIAR